MAQINIGVTGATTIPAHGIEFDGRIVSDESVEFHFSCTAFLDPEGCNFEIQDEFADHAAIKAASNEDPLLRLRLYNAFKSAVMYMTLGFHNKLYSENHYLLATVDTSDVKFEMKAYGDEE